MSRVVLVNKSPHQTRICIARSDPRYGVGIKTGLFKALFESYAPLSRAGKLTQLIPGLAPVSQTHIAAHSGTVKVQSIAPLASAVTHNIGAKHNNRPLNLQVGMLGRESQRLPDVQLPPPLLRHFLKRDFGEGSGTERKKLNKNFFFPAGLNLKRKIL
ncbi:MAG: hypothetical protein UY12_C0004G0024 [Parcubacteria group bacterium GW2011_GWA2_47_8b]|nr:MAG: hypothetical protein UY12_C0004G0024 [Parcubacteria group bacterium GW2011_GWA2_47_8b]